MTKQIKFLIFACILVCVLFLIMIFLLYSRSEQLLKNPLQYCADYIGEKSFCSCYNSKGNYYYFSNDEAYSSLTPIYFDLEDRVFE